MLGILNITQSNVGQIVQKKEHYTPKPIGDFQCVLLR